MSESCEFGKAGCPFRDDISRATMCVNRSQGDWDCPFDPELRESMPDHATPPCDSNELLLACKSLLKFICFECFEDCEKSGCDAYRLAVKRARAAVLKAQER